LTVGPTLLVQVLYISRDMDRLHGQRHHRKSRTTARLPVQRCVSAFRRTALFS
jgi:hypothetical protein